MMAQEYDHAIQSLSDGDYSTKAAVEIVEATFPQCDGVPSRYEAVIQKYERALLILKKSRKRLMEIMEKSQVKIFVLEGENRCYSCKRFVEDNSMVETKAEFEALHRRKMGIGHLKDLVDKKKNKVDKKKNNIVKATGGGCEEQHPLHQENLEQACFPAAHGGKIGSVELSQQVEDSRSVDEEDVGSSEQILHSEVVGLNGEELLDLITSRIISNLCKRSHTHFS